MVAIKPILTPVEEKLKLTSDGIGEYVNLTYFRSLVGSLRYLRTIRLDIALGDGLISKFMKS